jgi:hypothetical protein
MRLGPTDESGRPRPLPIEGSEFSAEYNLVFKATGEAPDISILPARFLAKDRRMMIDANTHLVGKNLFAAGDFVSGPVPWWRPSQQVEKQQVLLTGIWGTGLKAQERPLRVLDSQKYNSLSRKLPGLRFGSAAEGPPVWILRNALDFEWKQAETFQLRLCGGQFIRSPVLIVLNAESRHRSV